jgi:hypothetical protein
MLDADFVGVKYTWQGPVYHGGQHIYERLDRALTNDVLTRVSGWLCESIA